MPMRVRIIMPTTGSSTSFSKRTVTRDSGVLTGLPALTGRSAAFSVSMAVSRARPSPRRAYMRFRVIRADSSEFLVDMRQDFVGIALETYGAFGEPPDFVGHAIAAPSLAGL